MSEQRTYRAILADPPWAYQNWTDARNGAASSAMSCMEAEDIAAIPVADWAHPDGAHLFMWGTWPKLPEALLVIAAWGFDYLTAVPWTKTTPSTGDIRTGIGFWTRGASEILCIALRDGSQHQALRASPEESWEVEVACPVCGLQPLRCRGYLDELRREGVRARIYGGGV